MAKIKEKKVVVKKKAAVKKDKAARKTAKPKLTKKPALKFARKALKAVKPAGKIIPKKIKESTPVIEPAIKPTVIIPVPAQDIPQKIVHPKKIIKKKESPVVIEQKPAAPKIAAPVKITPKKEAKPHIPERPVAVAEKPAVTLKILELDFPVTIKDLAIKLQEKPSVLIKNLMGMGLMVGINQALDESKAAGICLKYGYEIKKAPNQEELALRIHLEKDSPELLKPRSPIVTLMGHVDHGKTSLLDAIRKTKVAETEHGGITQHIGAYRVVLPHGEITFLDTPGHEAFTAMRARGASVTDIVILVVAADDGIMPQTQEAIDHARAAGVPIIVAVNKVDKPQADIDRVKKQLSGLDLAAEDWGGKTITVPVSAKTGQGIDNLLEMILLEAQMLELKANPDRLAHGVVIEAKLTKGRGPVATLLVQNGTLHLGNTIIADQYYGKIKAMCNHRGQSITSAGPSSPVEVSGLSGIPGVGEKFFVMQDEKIVRDLALKRQEKEKQEQMKVAKRISLEDLHAQIQEGKIKELKMIIKADVQGSLEAIKETLNKLNVTEIKWNIIHEGVGSINSSDVILAIASDALILGFHVDAEELAKELSVKEGIDIRTYNIIYELANDIKAALEGMLEPKLKKVFLGRVEIRKVFKLSRSGTVAGCFVTKGKINRNASITLVRNGEAVFEGKLSSLKRFKDDVREVLEGFDCGITLSGFEEVKEGDVIEAYDIEKIARKL
ncbi:MAG: translation initiation factor IF-2 [Candidatus Omnitrophica bacterium]|nr:translation initiation factor IF-2 [Candidatus Omnitrophota bacterium]MDD5592388.1 translation initiation factor IF-2 [Candidatus Omnitrophota bacterium]